MKKRFFISILATLLLLSGCGAGDVNSNDSQGGASNSAGISGENSSSENNSSNNSSGGNAEETCVDRDDNGVCDDCSQSVLVTLDIFAINDLHGKVLDNNAQEGVDELSTYLQNAKAQNEYTMVLSSGDMWQGMAESNLTYGNLVTDWMNEMDFACMTLGNHEYDWGEEYIKQNAELAQFPFLAINVFDRSTNKRVEYCDASVMVEMGSLKVGVIGAMGDCYSSISADKVQDVYFKTGAQLTALVKAEAQALKAQGADCIVYSWHDGEGNDDYFYDETLSNGYVDVVFESHSHRKYVKQDSYGVYHLQGGGDNEGITRAKLTVNFARNEADTAQAKAVTVSEYRNLADHPVVDELTEKYSEQIAPARKELGKNDIYRDSWTLRQKIADLYYQAGVEKWGDEYDIVLGGGYLSARNPYNLYAGTVTYGDLYNIFPFDNPLVLCEIPGSALRSQFFETTNSSYFISYGAYGASVKDNIVDTQTYYIVIDTYSSLYAPNKATEIARYDQTTYARDLLADYIEAGGFTTQTDDSGNTGNGGNTGGTDDSGNTGNGGNTGGTDSEEIVLTPISQALEIGNSLQDNYITNDYFYVKGTVIDVPNATWGNLTLEDGEGNQIYVFGLYDTAGNKFNSENYNTVRPKQGDVIIVKSQIMKYYNANSGTRKIELKDATYIQRVSAVMDYSLMDIEDVYTIGQTLVENGATAEVYYVMGKIISIENATTGIFTIQDARGNTLYIYRTTDENGVEFGSMQNKPVLNQTVVVKGVIKRYVNSYNGNEKIEIYDGVIVPYEE